MDDLRRKRQSISSMMLRQGRTYPGKKTWGARHLRWLQEQNFAHPAQQLVLAGVAVGGPARGRAAAKDRGGDGEVRCPSGRSPRSWRRCRLCAA